MKRLPEALIASTRGETTERILELANRHMRWELNDLARRLDQRTEALLSVPALPSGCVAESTAEGVSRD